MRFLTGGMCNRNGRHSCNHETSLMPSNPACDEGPENGFSTNQQPNQPMNAAEKEQLFTIRWYVREKWGEESSKAEVLDLLGGLLEPGATPQDRPSVSKGGQKLLWCPFAERNFKKSRTAGSYAKGYPLGAIVHFTAGQSTWPGLGDRVSDDLVGIEIQCAGMLEKSGSVYKTWYGETVPASDVRTVAAQTANQEAGAYQKYTAAQEDALIRLLTWLRENNPDVFSYDYVLGHDEVSPRRKNDPGGSLSMTMPALRKKLKGA